MNFSVRVNGAADAPFRKPLALSYSVLLHGLFICLCVLMPSTPHLEERPVHNSLTPEEMKRVIWYDLRNDFPLIAPDQQKRVPQVKKGKSWHAVAAKPKQPQDANQYLLLPSTPKLAKVDLPVPDLLKVVQPVQPVPERPKPKAFLPPVPQPKRETAAVPNIEAPAVPLPRPASTGIVDTLIMNSTLVKAPPQIPDAGRQGLVETGTPQGTATETIVAGGPNALIVPGVTASGKPGGASAAPSPLDKTRSAAAAPAAVPEAGTVPAVSKFVMVAFPRGSTGISVAYWPGARTIGAVLESRFHDRAAYVTVIGAPAGFPTKDLAIWFAETGSTDIRLRPVVRPPVALQAAIPKSTFMLLDRNIPVAGFLRKTGRIDSLTVIDPHANSPLAQSYLEAIAEWTFKPATHNGEPIDVEVFLELQPPVSRIQTVDKRPAQGLQ